MFYLVLLVVIGCNIAPFIFYKLDIWHAQGIWVQTSIMMMFCYSFFEIPKKNIIKNKSLGLLNLWVGISTAWICYKSQLQGSYDIAHFFPYFNFLCMMIMYMMVVNYLDKEKILIILKWMKYTIIATLIMCVLQYLDLSQFFKLLKPNLVHGKAYFNNLVVGFIGNPTHLSGFLAMTSPLFLLENKREDKLALILMFIILCTTGTTLYDPSISGFIVLIGIWFYMIKSDKLKIFASIFCLIIFLILVWKFLPERFFSENGRFYTWSIYYDMFKMKPITGHGLGAVNTVYKSTALPTNRHFHMEYFQYMFEIGLIGFFLIVAVIKDFFSFVAKDKLQLTLKAIVLGFLISSCFNYPSRLWLPSVWVIFAYSAFYVIKNKEIKEEKIGK